MSNSLPDGDFISNVVLSGGSGRASVQSPADLHIEDGKITAEIVWNSPNYDYMEVNGTGYKPVNTEGNSAFSVEIPSLDSDIPVKAETVAMGTPHMIEYTLKFSSDLKSRESNFPVAAVVIGAAAVAAAAVIAAFFVKRRKKTNEKNL